MQVKIDLLTKEDYADFAELIKIFTDVFETENFTMPSVAYLQSVLDDSRFLVFTAKTDGQVIGGLTVYLLSQYYTENLLAYIYDVGIAEKFQRQGVGKKLIAAVADYCKENSIAEGYVQAEAEDEHAVEFYRSTRAIGSDMVNFNYHF